jgi:hypothetical protein
VRAWVYVWADAGSSDASLASARNVAWTVEDFAAGDDTGEILVVQQDDPLWSIVRPQAAGLDHNGRTVMSYD